MTQEALITAVEEQRSKLLNVLGTVQCMKVALRHDPDGSEMHEFSGAVELLEDEVQRIVTALEESSLRGALSDHRGTPGEEAAKAARKAQP